MSEFTTMTMDEAASYASRVLDCEVSVEMLLSEISAGRLISRYDNGGKGGGVRKMVLLKSLFEWLVRHQERRRIEAILADPWITVAEAAKYARVSQLTIRRAVASGGLTAIRVNGNRSIRTKAVYVDEWLRDERLHELLRMRHGAAHWLRVPGATK